MKRSVCLFAAVAFAWTAAFAISETITKFNYVIDPVTPWYYSATGEEVQAAGIKGRKYPVAMLPEETYLISTPIAIANYETLGFSCSYYVATKQTHAVALDVLDDNDEVVYSYTFSGTPSSEMSVGGYVSGVEINSPVVRFKLRLSDAYNATEIAYINEIQIYGPLKEWSQRVVSLLPYEITENGILVKWASVKDAVSYSIVCQTVGGGDETVVEVTADADKHEYSEMLSISDPNARYEYRVEAYNADGDKIVSETMQFSITSSNQTITADLISTGECCIYTLSGIKVKTFDGDGVRLNENLPAGVYIMQQPENSRLLIIR